MKVTSPGSLASTVSDQRKVKKLTQFNTAASVGIKQTTVSDFENQPESTKLKTLFKILSALELELYEVKTGAMLDKKKVWKQGVILDEGTGGYRRAEWRYCR